RPGFKRAGDEETGRRSPPIVERFDYSLTGADQLSVSWSTKGADNVQIHFQCVKGLAVSEIASSSNMRCGTAIDRNFPPNGSAKFLLFNPDPSSVPLVLNIQPFSAGVGYAKQSSTIIIQVK